MNKLSIGINEYVSLKNAYENAVKKGKEEFVWFGLDFNTQYAKYLLEYIESQSEFKQVKFVKSLADALKRTKAIIRYYKKNGYDKDPELEMLIEQISNLARRIKQ